MKSLAPDVPGAPSSTEWVQGIAGPLDEVAGLILDHQLVDQWVDGAIFPCELAFFLATCRMRHVEAIIESGRQDGYSTLVLGYFAQRYNVSIYSIDREIDRDRAQRCRKRLQGLPVQLLVGDAYDLVGRQLDLLGDRTTALLIDGPKGWAALSMIAAAMRPGVAVFALHNLIGYELEWVTQFGGRRYEDCPASGCAAWQELCRRETAHAAGLIARGNTPSTLGVASVDAKERRRIAHSFKVEFGLHQPDVVRLVWHTGLYRWVPRLYDISYRLFRR